MNCSSKLDIQKFLCGCDEYFSTECIIYIGKELPNLELGRGESLSTVLETIDKKIGSLYIDGLPSDLKEEDREQLNKISSLEADIEKLKVGTPTTWESVTGKPTNFPTVWDLVENKPTFFSGSWNDLTDKPESLPTTWDSIIGKPTNFASTWDLVSGKPNFFSGSWNDLTDKPSNFPTNWSLISGKPTFFSGDYNDLRNKPDIDKKITDAIGLLSFRETVYSVSDTPISTRGYIGDVAFNVSDNKIYKKTSETEWQEVVLGTTVRGDKILVGNGVPDNSLGNEGDLYFDKQGDNNLYKKGASTWELVGSLKGAKGDKGADGTSGGGSGTGIPTLPVPIVEGAFDNEGAIKIPVLSNNTFYDKFEISIPAYFSKTVAWTDKTQPLYIKAGASIYHILVRGVSSNGYVSELVHIKSDTDNQITIIDEAEYNRIKNPPA